MAPAVALNIQRGIDGLSVMPVQITVEDRDKLPQRYTLPGNPIEYFVLQASKESSV